MTVATLAEVLAPARAEGYALAGVVVLGWEDALAYVQAAEETGIPIILQAGPGCRAHTPVSVLGPMFRHLAEQASVPVVAHIDHGKTVEECIEAIDYGFTSLMYDGSALPLDENIENTLAVIEKARSASISVEGEVGFVGYAEGATSAATAPEEAQRFAVETGVDALAVSVGNVHLQTEKTAGIDFAAVAAIEAVCNVPLVIHGGSGVPVADRQRLARETSVCKFNIGTELRMAFGAALRRSIEDHPNAFDRISLLKPTIEPVRQATAKVLRQLRFPSGL
ncbi:class II fructose-bisphosphate aldolase [Pseudahrensia aquimaris]|uniref:Class II fructose-bisphosphate aldolase n=1 Tax=Pseudahrensia aquimaris TaxID=744461 RepID=A0ABW3FIC1_9HYPH